MALWFAFYVQAYAHPAPFPAFLAAPRPVFRDKAKQRYNKKTNVCNASVHFLNKKALFFLLCTVAKAQHAIFRQKRHTWREPHKSVFCNFAVSLRVDVHPHAMHSFHSFIYIWKK